MTQRPHLVDDLQNVDEHVAIMLLAATDKKVGVPAECLCVSALQVSSA